MAFVLVDGAFSDRLTKRLPEGVMESLLADPNHP
jgi:hypothetical protein